MHVTAYIFQLVISWWSNSRHRAVPSAKQYLQYFALKEYIPMTSTPKVSNTDRMNNTTHNFVVFVTPESHQTKLLKQTKITNYCRILRRDLSTQKLIQR